MFVAIWRPSLSPEGRMGERKAWNADWPGPRIGESRPPVKDILRASCGGESWPDGTRLSPAGPVGICQFRIPDFESMQCKSYS